MADRKYGYDGLLLSSAGEITVNKNGLWTGSCLFTVPKGRADLVPKIGSVHPYLSIMVAESFRLVLTPGRWNVSVEYVGGEDSEPQYELSPGTGNEPIETHNLFLELAGTPNSPENGAIFRDPETGEISKDNTPGAARFERFSIYLDDGSLNPFAGLESYIAQNNTVWTKTWTSKSKPSSTGVKISAPEGPAPEYGENTNWLELPTAYTKRGQVYTCTTRWLASGRRGWNSQIYP